MTTHRFPRLPVLAAAVISLALFAGGAVSAKSEESPESTALREALLKRFPTMAIERIDATPVKGVLAVVGADGSTLYGTEDGRYLFSGDLFELRSDALVNLSEATRTEKRKTLLGSVADEQMVIFPAADGAAKATVTVFTDVDCGFCRKLHLEVPELNAMGVEVRYLAYPRAGVGSESYKKIVSAWCADDANTAITKLKAGESIPPMECENPVADQFNLGRKMGISGTPAIVLQDGRLIPGYRPAKDLAKELGI